MGLESVLSGEKQGGDDGREEETLRPKSLEHFVGQTRLIDNLKVAIEAAQKRKDVLDHVLFCGPPGLGKTTLARIIAEEMGAKLHSANGPALSKPAELASILTQLEAGDVFFLDEIHRISPTLEEYLYSAMEDFVIDIVLESSPSNSRTVRLELPKFTLVGATTKEGAMQAPFRDRFGIFERLKYYEVDQLQTIITRSSRISKMEIEPEAAKLLASRSRGTPRVANRFLRRVRDLATLSGSQLIKVDMVLRTLDMLDIDELGLQYVDRRILETLFQSGDRPVGLNTLAVSIGEDRSTVEDVYEPFLIQQGLIQKTAQGRILTDKGHRKCLMNLSSPKESL
jgi:holliday junction DNA helicase RuvB